MVRQPGTRDGIENAILFEVLRRELTRRVSESDIKAISKNRNLRLLLRDRVRDQPRFRYLPTKISRDLAPETEFIQTWLEVVWAEAASSEGSDICAAPPSKPLKRTLEKFFSGVLYLVSDAVSFLDEYTLFCSDAHFRRCSTVGIRLVRDIDQLDATTAWKGRLRPIVEKMRKTRLDQVRTGDERLARRMLERDVTWLSDPAFSVFLEDLWTQGLDRSWSRGLGELKKDVQYWFRLRQSRAKNKPESVHKIALLAAVFESTQLESTSASDLAAAVDEQDYGLGIDVATVEKYLRKDKAPELASLVGRFLKTTLGKAMSRTALRSPSVISENLEAAKKKATVLAARREQKYRERSGPRRR